MRNKQASSQTSRAIGYVRVSSEEQRATGVSLSAQESAIRAYCAMRGLELVELVSDAGVSGGIPIDDREGGRRLSELVRKRAAGSIVAMKLDRLFRDCADCLTVTRAWDRLGVALHLIDLGGTSICTNSALGTFFLTVIAGAAELERNLIRERTTFALAHKRDKGERVGQVPFGYKLAADRVHLDIEPTEQGVLARIRELRSDGLSYAAVAERLNAERLPARGRQWHVTTVARLVARQSA